MENEKLVIDPKRPKGEDGFRTFSVRVHEDIVARIDQISAQTNRSRNELIGTFLEYALDNCVVGRTKPPSKQRKIEPAFESNLTRHRKD